MQFLETLCQAASNRIFRDAKPGGHLPVGQMLQIEHLDAVHAGFVQVLHGRAQGLVTLVLYGFAVRIQGVGAGHLHFIPTAVGLFLNQRCHDIPPALLPADFVDALPEGYLLDEPRKGALPLELWNGRLEIHMDVLENILLLVLRKIPFGPPNNRLDQGIVFRAEKLPAFSAVAAHGIQDFFIGICGFSCHLNGC